MNITKLNKECIKREKGKVQINIAQGREYLRCLALILNDEKAMKKFVAYVKRVGK